MSPPIPPSALTPDRRARVLDRLSDGWRPDVLVVGAGFTGCGIALDAALRGLSVLVVERGDLAQGTSRWSSKMVHGGLRYLATGDLPLAHESAVERHVLMARVAPHLTRALPFVTPLVRGVPLSTGLLAGVGYAAGNALRIAAGTPGSLMGGPRWLTPSGVRAAVPAVRRDGLRGGWRNTDGQLVDDARFVVAIARTAAAFGAEFLLGASADAVTARTAQLTVDAAASTAAGGGSVSGAALEVHAGRVVIAAGAWSDQLDPRVRLRPSRGVHLVVDGAALGHPSSAMSTPLPGHLSRFVIVLPQPDGRVYIGLTDDPVTGDIPDETTALPEERDLLLDAVNRVLDVPLQPADVVGSFGGYRPLVDLVDPDAVDLAASGTDPAGRPPGTGEGATSDLSRAHLVLADPDGPVTIVGGKLTTYRRMAADVVDVLTDRPCTTAGQPLVGALPRRRLAEVPASAWLVGRHGAEAVALRQQVDADPWMAERVIPHLPHLRAELVWAVQREGARTVADLLDRRTRIGLVPEDRAAAEPVAAEALDRALT